MCFLAVAALSAVLEGMDVARRIEAVGTASGTPKKKVKIVDAGELPL